jgi:hypothetical protein
MSRASSASVYGSSWIDLGRVPARRSRRAYGLRTASHPDGWAPAGARARRRAPRETVDADGILSPVTADDDDAPVRRYVRTDYAAERHAAGVIRMGDF